LWHGQGKSAEAYAALSKTYDRFEEGFDTADLQEARDLLHHSGFPNHFNPGKSKGAEVNDNQ
jgi:hypothetical protein